MIRTSAHLFEIASRFASKDEARYYLNGVFVEPHPCGGVNLVATDGHRLFIAYDPKGLADAPAIVRLGKNGLKSCKPTAAEKKANQRRTLSVAGELATITDASACIMATERDVIIDGTFPDYRRVVPNTSDATGAPGSFNPQYLADLAKAGIDLTENGSAPVTIRGNSANDPHLITWETVPNAMAVLMPIRTANEGKCPAFFDARPYGRPIVDLAVKSALTIAISVNRSPISAPSSRVFTFATPAQAIRVHNRLLAGLQTRGQCADAKPLPRQKAPFELVWERWAAEATRDAEQRAKRMDEARDTFETATDADLRHPWRLDIVTAGADPHDRQWRMRGLRDVSEARAVATAYGVAA